MSAENDYPRMMFHRLNEPVIVNSEEEEEALGAGWHRIIQQPGDPDPPDAPKKPAKKKG